MAGRAFGFRRPRARRLFLPYILSCPSCISVFSFNSVYTIYIFFLYFLPFAATKESEQSLRHSRITARQLNGIQIFQMLDANDKVLMVPISSSRVHTRTYLPRCGCISHWPPQRFWHPAISKQLGTAWMVASLSRSPIPNPIN